MSAESEIEKLANYIMAEIPYEPSQSDGAGGTAIRTMKYYRQALIAISHELGVPQPDYPAPVSNAAKIAVDALKGIWID